MDPSKNFSPILFSDEAEPKAERSINYSSNFKFLPMVTEKVGPEVWEHVKKSPLGIICKFEELKFAVSTRLVHFILCKQLLCKKPYELWFLIAGQPTRFSLFEFEEITGLNCDELPDSPVEVDKEESSRFWGLFNLSLTRSTPCIENIVRVCTGHGGCSSWSRKDKIMLSYLAILTTGLLGLDRREAILPARAKLVMDLELFETYPWGRLAFEDLVKHLKLINKKRIHQRSYVCKEFMQVLQIWAYHYIPHLGESIGRPITSKGPPLLRFKGKNDRLGFDSFFSNNKDNDEYDAAIDNLLAYILEGNDLTGITWRALPVWPVPESNGARRKPDPLADKRKKRIKEYVEDEGNIRSFIQQLAVRVRFLEQQAVERKNEFAGMEDTLKNMTERVALLEEQMRVKPPKNGTTETSPVVSPNITEDRGEEEQHNVVEVKAPTVSPPNIIEDRGEVKQHKVAGNKVQGRVLTRRSSRLIELAAKHLGLSLGGVAGL